ncbi:hypothetical protein B7494_g4871 [Chlorociboria aeruginascens]|nr:hypothetical protein B7494_g4871 [Chlorociboria aeruginascens]
MDLLIDLDVPEPSPACSRLLDKPLLASDTLESMLLLDNAMASAANSQSLGGVDVLSGSILQKKGDIDSPSQTKSLPITSPIVQPPPLSAAQTLVQLSALPSHPTSSRQYPILLQKMASHASPILQTLPTATAPRNNEDLIADLMRPLHWPPLSPPRTKHREALGTELLQPTPETTNDPVTAWLSKTEDAIPEERAIYCEEENEDEEVRPMTEGRKITERHRKLDAIADNHLRQALLTSIKKDMQVKPNEESQQSTKWLVNQSESQQIISTPREYQIELFERAKVKNIIAVLDTGSGKTLISVLLLRHIFAQELEDRAMLRPKRISFFLVDSVTLVYQQHAVLKANLDQEMDMFCGDMGCDLWSRKHWEKHFTKNMVIVCTAEVLYQCLHHSFITMDRINLLIFDEAHHAKKNHSYARIIKDFYLQVDPKTVLPKIFGMTASPVDARVDVKKAAAELEALLNCEIATAAEATLLQFAIKTQVEQLAKYDALGPRFETPLYREMYARFKGNVILRKPLHFSFEATRELGSWCADQVWIFCMSEEEVKKLQAKTERQYHSRRVQEPLEVLETHKTQLGDAQEIVRAHIFDQPHYDSLSVTSRNLSSKVVLLVKYLKERFERPTDDKCIIFVKQRYTARLLAKLFSHQDIGTKYLRVGTLVGTGSSDAGELNVSFREQVITMMNFRKGALNCLFATSVAEEGLDIPDCNLVIRFDLYTTLIQYIQSRGRARHANSRYIHMCEDRNQEHAQIIREVRMNENILKRFCAQLPEERLLRGNDFDMDHFLGKERTHRTYTVPETGAKLTYRMSLMVLANFVDSLDHPTDGSSRNAEYVVTVQNKQFVCETILPEVSPIRGAIGRPASTKQVAKCSAAFETCLLLRKGRYLDEWLLPTFTKQLPAMRNAILAVDSKKCEAYDMRTKPSLWSIGGIPEKLYLTVLKLVKPECLDRPCQPVALLTRTPIPKLPSFVLHFGAGLNSPIESTPISRGILVDSTIIRQVNNFTLTIFHDVFSKEYESDVAAMPYFILPIQPDAGISKEADPSQLIAWDVLNHVDNHLSEFHDKHWENTAWRDETDESLADKYVVDPWDGSRKLWTVGVSKYKPLDPPPPNTAPRKNARQNTDNIMEYSSSLWAKARARRTFDENQRVFEASLISLRRNLLDEFDASGVENPKQCFIILEPLKISPLPTTVVAMVYLFPAIIHRIESYLIALEACSLLHLDIRPDLALEAVTKDSENTEDHGREQLNFQRGMGNNYERLEFLGDCFLKMATSISLYGIKPTSDEYQYHVDRMLLICNKNLMANSVKLKLYEFIRSQGFNRRAWYPEGMVLRHGKAATAPKSQRLGDKVIADVSEALIGAALLTHHESKNMDHAVRAVTELVCSQNHNAISFADYYKLYKKPKYQTAAATAAQKDLATQVESKHTYHFRYPRVLRSAFVHPSYPFSYENIPSYQRLEFLGDSLLDMACVNFLFHNFPGRDPQWLTEHKMAMVSNQFLGALCVHLGFQRHLLIFNATFQKQISDYVTDITEARLQAEEEAISAGKTANECAPDYWTSVKLPPKCLPDIVEAYVGAIFVDSEYNYAEVERFFDEHIKWYFRDISIYDTYANKHPVTFLGNFLQTSMGCSDWNVKPRPLPTIDGCKPKVMAMVIIHGQVVADYLAESGRYALLGAAKKALALLEGLPLQEFREKFECRCRPREGDSLDDGEEHSADGSSS